MNGAINNSIHRVFTVILLFVLSSNLFADIGVKSFRKLGNDLDARVNAPLKDQNGDICAIIKVVTTQTGFTFDCGQLGIVKTVQKPSEIWIYVPFGVKKITITHPQLGMLREYFFPEPIEEATVYELVLITGKVVTTVDETIESQWLLITPEPSDAMVYINEKFVKSGIYQAKLKPGSYTYRVEAPKYHPEAGKTEITDTKKELVVKLKPAFGYISITSEPEIGAKVIIDGETLEKTTPCQSDTLISGEHTVQVIKEGYQPVTQKVTVTDGKITTVNLSLNPNFADVSVTTFENAEIFIDNELKGKGSWQGRLGAGVYSLEARLDRHKPAKKDIEVIVGEKQNIDLSPVPVYGSVDVITTPPGATININGKDYGTTPNTINKLLIGDNNIQLSMQGYATVNRTITITEAGSTEVNETLADTRPVSANQPKVKPETVKKPDLNLGSDYYRYKKSRNFWLVSGLVTLSAGTFSYIQSGKYYTQYKNSTTEAASLHQKVKTFDTVYPICFALTGFSAVEFIIKAGKQGKAKTRTLGLYPQPVFNVAGLGIVYHF